MAEEKLNWLQMIKAMATGKNPDGSVPLHELTWREQEQYERIKSDAGVICLKEQEAAARQQCIKEEVVKTSEERLGFAIDDPSLDKTPNSVAGNGAESVTISIAN